MGATAAAVAAAMEAMAATEGATMAIRPTMAATMAVMGGTEAEDTMEEAGAATSSHLSGRARAWRVQNYIWG